MPKLIFQTLLVLLSSYLLIACNSEKSDNSKRAQLQSETIDGFIPAGWQLLTKTKFADLNKDGKQDIAISITEKKADASGDQLTFRLMILLGTETGYRVDYDIPVDLGETPNIWQYAEDIKRFSMAVIEKNDHQALDMHIQTSYDHNTSDSSHDYQFAYTGEKMTVIGYQERSMRFDYSSVPDQKYAMRDYDFLHKTLAIKDSNNTDIPACSSSASEAKKEDCPAPIDEVQKLSLPKAFSPEISEFENFTFIDWQKDYGVQPIAQ